MTRLANRLSSRVVLAAVLLARIASLSARADEWRTSSSLMGESKYGENFQHYDYVNPDAPKGGTLNSVASARSTASIRISCRASPAAGFVEFGGGLLYDTLMEQATDEPSVSHPLIADAYKYPDDYSRRRPTASIRARNGMTASRSRSTTWSGRSTC